MSIFNFTGTSEREKGLFGAFHAHNIETIFIHELGHYFAQLINSEKDERWKPVEVSLNSQINNLNQPELCGVVHNDFAEEHKVEQSELPEFIGSVIMGCVFQSFHLQKGSLDVCLNTNGCKDRNGLFVVKNSFGLSHELLDRLKDEEDRFYEKMIAEKTIEFVEEIDPREFILNPEVEGKWLVDLEKLGSLTEKMSETTFKENYLQFVDELKKIINPN